MKRDTTQHAPRIDDEMKKEVRSLTHGSPVESHKEEFREQEGPADDERVPSSRTVDPRALGPDDASARAELSRHLRASVFPADRDALLAEAEENDAPTPVLAVLRQLPSDSTYGTVYEVWEALGGRVDHVAGRPERRSEGAGG